MKIGDKVRVTYETVIDRRPDAHGRWGVKHPSPVPAYAGVATARVPESAIEVLDDPDNDEIGTVRVGPRGTFVKTDLNDSTDWIRIQKGEENGGLWVSGEALKGYTSGGAPVRSSGEWTPVVLEDRTTDLWFEIKPNQFVCEDNWHNALRRTGGGESREWVEAGWGPVRDVTNDHPLPKED